ncbi:MAG TPA: ROK family protein [Steroidobacteraceae bacterium]|nr:ROK family protein [Steroidobacteraceae bacterium]
MTEQVFAAIETGGTKILARLVSAHGEVLADGRWPTATPARALEDLAGFISKALCPGRSLGGIGIAAFGPLVRDALSRDYGLVLSTPKPGWSGSNLRAALAARFGVAVDIDTDVNAAARAEWRRGAGRGMRSLAYVTVGTGIGGGLVVDGRALQGALHPEIGHIRLARREGDRTPSACPFHDNCVEGLASGAAIAHRLTPGRTLADDAQVLAIVADYLGELAATLTLSWSPQRIVWGGGVMSPQLLEPLRAALHRSLAGYGVAEAVSAPQYCVLAALEHAGLEGALIMAARCADVF